MHGEQACLSNARLELIAWNRIQAFFFIHVTTLVTEFIAPPLAAVLLNTCGPHFAFLAAIPFELAAFLALGLIKEPKHDLNDECTSNPDECEDGNDHHHASKSKTSYKQPLLKVVQYLREDVGSLLSQRQLLLGLLAVVGCRLGRPMLELILQYMSVKFGWHFSKVRDTYPPKACLILRLPWTSNECSCRPTISFQFKPPHRFSSFWWFYQASVHGWYARKATPLQLIWLLREVLSWSYLFQH